MCVIPGNPWEFHGNPEQSQSASSEELVQCYFFMDFNLKLSQGIYLEFCLSNPKVVVSLGAFWSNSYKAANEILSNFQNHRTDTAKGV